MDIRRLIVIFSISIVFITLFCGDTIEGNIDGDDGVVGDDGVGDVGDDDDGVVGDDDGGVVGDDGGAVFGVGCLENCKVFSHECEVKQEYKMVNGKRRNVVTYGNIEQCPYGEIPDETCDDTGWGCRSCKPGFFVGTDKLCKPLPSKLWTLAIIICIIIFTVIGFIIYLKVLEYKAIAIGLGVKRSGVLNKI